MSSSKVLRILALLLATTCAASAQLMQTGVGLAVVGPTPPSCSDSLDFTDACNSQYIGALQ